MSRRNSRREKQARRSIRTERKARFRTGYAVLGMLRRSWLGVDFGTTSEKRS